MPYIPPDFLDNTEDRALADALVRLITEWEQTELDIATGFFEPHVWRYLQEAFPHLRRLRLLLGRPPEVPPQGEATLDLRRYFHRKLRGDLEALPYNPDYAALVDALLAFLRREEVEVRLYGRQFLHAKAYLFPQVAIVGSSNLTPSGLTRNSELNLVRKEAAVADALRREWFERFWEEAEDYKADLIQALEDSKFGTTPYTPFQVFIKALYEYFRDRLDVDAQGPLSLGVDLASFQQEGLREAIRLLERHRGVLIADAVGLGKTYIAMGLMEHYLLGRRRRGYIPKGLVVCPAQLRDLVWRPRLDEYGIKATIVSMEEMGRADFDWRAYNDVDLVVVDESHNFRNPSTGRYRNLMKLLATGKRDKRLVLMTATPINNTVWDLYHQISLITRAEDTYYRDYGIRNLQSFFRAVDRGEAELFDLLEEVAVRRSRYDIRRRQEAGETIILPGKGEIRFPERRLDAIHYDLTHTYDGFYAEVAAAVEALALVPYNLERYRKERDEESERILERNNALIGILKTTFLKRLESSLAAFEVSVTNAARFQRRFFEILVEEGRLLDSPHYRRILALEEEGEEADIEAILADLPEVSIADYDLRAIREALENDLTLFDGMLRRLEKIRGADEAQRDGKLAAVKERLIRLLTEGHKVLLFTYYQDTARYLYDQLQTDEVWRAAAGEPGIGLITGDTDPATRTELVRRFAPQASAPDMGEAGTAGARRAEPPVEPLQLLISTDVLSEGQNLQDADVVLNYDLHWNPVRMIQRAGRIDRLGSPHETLLIINCFPEEGLEELLRLVERLQQRIRDIDRTVGLDASVLGEVVTPRSLEELRRIKAGDRAVLDELEREMELTSTDEMKLPLVLALQQWGEEKVRDIPLGIHSGKRGPVRGVFFAFRARDRHFWRFYPADGGPPITDKRQIFRWIQAGPEEERLPPDVEALGVFDLLERATEEIVEELRQARAGRRVRPKMYRLNRRLYNALAQPGLFEREEIEEETWKRVRQALEEVSLRPFRRDPALKRLLADFERTKDRVALLEGLDAWLVENELYREVTPPTVLEQITREDLQLVCWEAVGME
ncbi:MAG TPA: helicase [Thermoflexia bacterium]|jgi:superfamily II DNA or RNA helicase|nr:helicase [Thermoflexia bacterium]